MKKLLLIAATTFSVVAAQAQCQADFVYTSNVNVFQFTDSSTAGSGSIATWLWTFGDNTAPATTQNPQHTYVACGYYVVTLNIVTTAFCTSSYTDTVFVSQGTLPSFTFSVDTTNGDVNFQGAPFSSTLNYSWNFGDSNTGTGQNPVHTYDSSGTYIACLTISDTGGFCTYVICDTVVVYIAPANCSVTWTNQSLIVGQQTFTAQPFNLGWTYTWDFGDLTAPGNGFIVNHTYANAGTYTVCLTVYDSATTCTSQFCDTVQVVFPSSCPVTFTNVNLAGNMSFTPTPLSPLNTYVWDFGDATAPFTGLIASHTYAAPGTYTVCVTMTTFQGCTSTFCDTVNIPTVGYEEHGKGIEAVTVYPNPASQLMSINYTLTHSGDVTVEIIDVSGRLIFVRTQNDLQQGTHRSEISLEDFAAGSYLLRVRTADGAAHLPFVKE